MAVEAPRHALRLVLVDDLHLVDRSVATVAADTAVHVNSVVEVGIVWEFVDANPVDRFPSFPAFTNSRELGTIGFDLRVAGHAGLGGGNVGVRSHLNEAMTITAIHPELLDVDDVGEWNWLCRLVADPCVFWGEVIGNGRHQKGDNCASANDQLQGNPVSPLWEKICHRSVLRYPLQVNSSASLHSGYSRKHKSWGR